MTRSSPQARRRVTTFRRAGWLAVAGMIAMALAGPSAGIVRAAGPGNNGLDPTGNGTKSNATVGGSLADAGNSATMGSAAVLFCSGTNAGSLVGSFTLTKTLDVGSTIVVYLVPNNGSNATPAANVSKNETTVTAHGQRQHERLGCSVVVDNHVAVHGLRGRRSSRYSRSMTTASPRSRRASPTR